MKFFNLSIFALVLALAFPVKAFSQEVVIDFSDLTPGQVFVGDEYAGLGVTFTNTPSSHPMVIQDSSNPNLPAPSQDHFNPLQGNVLIVSKYKQPNGSQREYASPHSFVMEFSTPVTFGSITTMDNESRGSYIQAFGENGLIKKVDVPVVPDGTNNWENSLQVVRVDAEEVTRVVFFSKGSTFIDDITYDVPDPAQCPNPEGNAKLFNI